jgi:hypothetical protein
MKKFNSKKIKFASSGFSPGSLLEHSDVPSPAKNFVPEWYRSTKNIKRDSAELAQVKNIKDCVPFADALLSGYIWTTPCDIYVERVPDSKAPRINFTEHLSVMDVRESSSAGLMKVPDGCYETHFVWKHPMHISTPKGYSILVTHPLNRHDLPFISLSGIVDCDSNPFRPGNYPFFIKKNFDGLIPKGTPALQIIPIKREDWVSERDQSMIGPEWLKNSYEVGSVNVGWYKKNHWNRKSYN